MKRSKDIFVPRDKGFDSGLVRLELLLLHSESKDRKRNSTPSRPLGRMGQQGLVGKGAGRSTPKPELQTPPKPGQEN